MDGRNEVTNGSIINNSETKPKRSHKRKQPAPDSGNTNSTDTETRNTTTIGTTDNSQEQPLEENHGIPVLNIEVPETKARPSRSRKAAPTSKDEKGLEANINVLLTTTFGLMSIRMGEHWNMSIEESSAISEPLARILNRLIPAETSGKYTDYILLMAGLTLTLTPRILMSKEVAKLDQTRKVTKVPSIVVPEPNNQPDKTRFDDDSIKGILSGY